MKLCAPAKQLFQTDKVDFIELDQGSHKCVYQQGRLQYVDVDWKNSALPSGDVLVSYHNFEETPNLEAILKILQITHPKAHLYKIATMAHSTLDSLLMLEFLQRHPGIIGLCMGELGAITRILAPIFQVPIVYAPLSVEEKNAPGQLLVDQLCEIYHFRTLNPETKIYGLIGDPVFRSIGHLFHNEEFKKSGKNAVYLKMVVKPDELSEFFRLAKKLPFAGLSVTAPLKEAVLPFVNILDPEAEAIGAVNTLTFKNGKIEGCNTDGEAAMDVLGDVKDRSIVVLGAGGASRAILYTALKRGARATVVNRAPAKAQALACRLGCQWSEKIPAYDILINATSTSMPIKEGEIQEGKCVMDIALYETEFLKAAREKQCECLDGFHMYFQQALAQQEKWCPLE
ncbi:MAG TPA: type I 3-dehydroquinate dehydratase [Rhabdochlamydiaceae bacterium]|nr:type I 3-dehydroquinate dehydratase [Rhabdochlamydiaceae bacterium]